jgi:hypothetical protein
VVPVARTFLEQLPLRRFGTSQSAAFCSHLDRATEELLSGLPDGARHWGLARKLLNIFLRDALYTGYLADEYSLQKSEGANSQGVVSCPAGEE